MRTDDLIKQLAAEPAARPGRMVEARLAVASAGALALVLAIVLIGFGVRPGLAAALLSAAGAVKLIGGIAIAAIAFRIACHLSRPGRSSHSGIWTVLILASISAAAAILAGLVPAGTLACTALIVALSPLPLAASLAALRAGAPTDPVTTGAAAGLLSGGIAAIGFAVTCPVDDPASVVAGYGMAIAAVALGAAAAGSRLLRW